MLFTQADLNTSISSFDILNESIYIDHNTISPNTVGVVINEDLNAGIVRFNDVESISEEYGCDYIDAMIAIAEANDIDPNQLAVAIDEAEVIENPNIIYELANVVINPISENSLAYIFCESMIDAYIETEDEDYLYGIVNEGVLDTVKNAVSNYGQAITGHKTGHAINAQLRQDAEKFKSRGDTLSGDMARLAGSSNNAQQVNGLRQAQWNSEDNTQSTYKGMIDAADARDADLRRSTSRARLGTAAAVGALGALAYKNRDKLKAAGSKLAGTKAGQAAISKGNALAGKVKGKLDSSGITGKVNAGIAAAKGKLANTAVGQKLGIKDPAAIAKEAEGKPKRWIARKIASLRSIYANYLQKAREAGPNAGTFKKIASKILGVIDMLLEKLEKATS